MKITNALILCFILNAGLALGQADTFQLSDYRARFGRRPAMFLAGSFDYNGAYSRSQKGWNAVASQASLSWMEQRNTDALISTWEFSGNLSGRFGLQASGFQQRERYNTGRFYLAALSRQLHYRDGQRFWGQETRLVAEGITSSLGNGSSGLMAGLSASLFSGKGRIEFAEDALLARWMLDDLQQAGLVEEYSPEDAFALARTITDIIGNRTFDFRRRRIYELDRLQATVRQLGLAEGESFLLFAILNDNWAFANRASIRHGRQLSYGLKANSRPAWEWRGNSLEELDMDSYGLAFGEYTGARTIKQNGGDEWTTRLEAGYFIRQERLPGAEWAIGPEGVFTRASLSYRRIWLPSSRTALSWNNTASVTWGVPVGENQAFVPQYVGRRADWNSSLTLEYFVNYQWAFRIQASARFFYLDEPDRLDFNHYLRFNTVYLFF